MYIFKKCSILLSLLYILLNFVQKNIGLKIDYKLQRTSYCSRPTPRNKAIEVVHLYNYLN